MAQAAAPADWKRELRVMVSLATPVVLSELGWMLQGVVDTIMVGKLGPSAIGAVAVANAVYYTPSLFGIGLVLGLDTLVSQAYGRGDHDACHHWLAQGVYLACIASLPLMVLAGGASFALTHVGIAAEVAAPAGSYLRILVLGTLPLLLYGAALPAGRGPGPSHHGNVSPGQPGELVLQLGLSLRQAGNARHGRARLGILNGAGPHRHGRMFDRICLAL
jgi:MATE family multidrug resistance protein